MSSATEQQQQQPWAIVVGSGPSGLLLGLLLAKRGIPVRLLDAGAELDKQPRATHYAPPAVHELWRAGVSDEIRAAGFTPKSVFWRKFDDARTPIAELDGSVADGEYDRMICLPLNFLSQILLKRFLEYPGASVSWSHKVTGIGQDDAEAWVDVETPDGKQTLKAKYVIGCDGANSQIRRSLFGDWEFPGKTWDEQIVATNVYFPFEKFGYGDANFFIDKDHWHMSSKITKDGMWRVTYGEQPGLSVDEMRARQPEKFRQILPTKPGPDGYKLANFSPYKIHQRLAKRMRVGRFCLAADAAHLCNPFGGLGLTGGIVDVGGLYDCLAGIYEGKADDSILDKYDEVRRAKYNEIVDPMSSENLRRLWQDPDRAIEVDEFLQMCKRTETDKEFAKQCAGGMSILMHDFTQYYKKEAEGKPAAAMETKLETATQPVLAVGSD